MVDNKQVLYLEKSFQPPPPLSFSLLPKNSGMGDTVVDYIITSYLKESVHEYEVVRINYVKEDYRIISIYIFPYRNRSPVFLFNL